MRGRGCSRKVWIHAWAAILVLVGQNSICAQSERWEQAIQAGEQALQARDYEQAEMQFQAALDQASTFAANDPRRVSALVHLARLYQAQGDYAKPENLYHQALKLAKTAYTENEVEYARYLHEVGGYYHTRRKYDMAEEYYKKAFAMRVRNLGREHVDVAESIHALGILYENQARFNKAEVYYEHALRIREKLLGAGHLDTVLTMEHFTRLLNRLQQGARAMELAIRAQKIRKERVDQYNEPGLDLGEAYTVQEVRRPPRLDGRVEPEYTDEARKARHAGIVVLQTTIDRDGRPRTFQLLRSLGLGLDEKAVEAVRQWKFRPARKDGKRVAVITNIEIEFQLL